MPDTAIVTTGVRGAKMPARIPRWLAILLLVAVHACVLSTVGSADGGPRFGVSLATGVGYLSQGGSEFDRLALGGGAAVEWPLDPKLRVWSGVQWNSAGSGFDSAYPEITHAALRLQYVTVPVGLKYRLRAEHRLPIVVTGGLAAGYLVDAKLLTEELTHGESSRDITDDSQRWDFATSLGIGVLASPNFELSLLHSWSLRPVSEDFQTRSLWLSATFWH